MEQTTGAGTDADTPCADRILPSIPPETVTPRRVSRFANIARPRAQPVPEIRKGKRGSIMKLRRRVPRQPAGWNGTCHVEGETADGWRPCRVVDISMLGLGMTFNHPSPSHLVGRRISVDVPAVGDSVSIQLEGRVANAGPTLGGAVRVGIEFDGLSESELGIATAQGETSHRTGARLKPISGR